MNYTSKDFSASWLYLNALMEFTKLLHTAEKDDISLISIADIIELAITPVMRFLEWCEGSVDIPGSDQ